MLCLLCFVDALGSAMLLMQARREKAAKEAQAQAVKDREQQSAEESPGAGGVSSAS